MTNWDILVRVRPIKENFGRRIITVGDLKTLHLEDKSGMTAHQFDGIYGEDTAQETLFDDNIAHLIDSALTGTNISVFAYGPTGTGKTYTMLGTDSNPGIIPRTVLSVLNNLRDEGLRDEGMESKLHMSFLEVYNEKVSDLLADSVTQDIKIRATREGEIELVGLTKCAVKNFDEFVQVFDPATERRSTGGTLMNSESSRSHSILTLYINKRKKNDDGGWVEWYSKVNLIDLAGSEDNRNTNTKAGSTVFKEATKINLSLTVLKRVITCLSKKEKPPCRDSKLTRILSDCLGGNAKCVMFLMVAPEEKFANDTKSSLTFARVSRKCENQVIANVETIDPNSPARQIASPKPSTPTPTTPLRDIRHALDEKMAGFKRREAEYRLERQQAIAKRRKTLKIEAEVVEPDNEENSPEKSEMEKDDSPDEAKENRLPRIHGDLFEDFADSLNQMDKAKLLKLKAFPKKRVDEFIEKKPFNWAKFLTFMGDKKAKTILLKN